MKPLKIMLTGLIMMLIIPVMGQEKTGATALLVIDVQDFYFPGGDLPLVNPEKAAENTLKLIKRFRETKREVIYIRHKYEPGGEINSMIEPMGSEMVFTKEKANSFLGTGLEEYLRKKGITTLVICGMQTHMCVEAATRAASDLGFSCTVIDDACTTRDLTYGGKTIRAEDVHLSTLSTLKSYASITTTDEYLNNY